MKRLFTFAIIMMGALLCNAQENFNCFGIIVGKNASATGEVILGHNEDDDPEQMLNLYTCPDGLWAEFPGMEQADAFLNKYGVAIVSDFCGSKSEETTFTDGGVVYEVRCTVAKEAKTARQAVDIIGKLVETRGYRDSGRSYLVADPNEAWIVSVVKGRQWVAQRVPDDAVMIIPNYYVIDKIDFTDQDNFAGSDVFSYAMNRQWYNFRTDGPFSFRKVFGSEKNRASLSNINRHRNALKYFGQPDPEDPDKIPFCFKPEKKVSIEDVMKVLSIHEATNSRKGGSICNDGTVVSTVFQLRANMPLQIGCVMWTAMGHPCIEAYLPIYLGTTAMPTGWARCADVDEATTRHFQDSKNLKIHNPSCTYWRHLDRWDKAKKDAPTEVLYTTYANKFQADLFKKQAGFEKSLKGCFNEDGTVKNQKSLDKKLNKTLADTYLKYIKGF